MAKLCSPCSKLSEIYICGETSMEIGIVRSVSTVYYVYIQNIANENVVKYSATSDSNGLLTITNSNGFDLAENTFYEIWLNITNDENDREPFFVKGISNTCFSVKFSKGIAPDIPAFINRQVYIDDFDTVLGNSPAENTLKSFLVNKGFQAPIFYLSNLLDNPINRTSMRALNLSLNGLGVTNRSANVIQSINAIDESNLGTPAGFNTTCSSNSEKFNHFTSEAEFWHNNGYYATFDEFAVDAQLTYDYCNNNGIIYDAYVSRCLDLSGIRTPEYVADWLVKHFDTILLENYISTASFLSNDGMTNHVKIQLQLLADAAYNNNKIQKVQILFASEGNTGINMGSYYNSYPTLTPSFTIFENAYNALSYSNKDSIDLNGQSIFAYQSLKNL
jgi:hypothetical protein